jgi:hypothetical protein
MIKASRRIVLLGVALAALAPLAAAVPASANVIKPDGVPGHHKLIRTITPSQLYTWRFPSNSPGGWTCTISQVHLHKSVLALRTKGTNGNCAVIQSKKLFRTASGVIEARIYLSAIPGHPAEIADWASMWMYGRNWPTGGEIDAVESGHGSSAVTYHYGSSNPSSPSYNLQYTTFRPLYGNARPLPITGPNVKPGWNTVDIAFSPKAIRIYYNGKRYTTAAGRYITGKPAYLVFDDVSASSAGPLGIPGQVLVRYVRVFT